MVIIQHSETLEVLTLQTTRKNKTCARTRDDARAREHDARRHKRSGCL